jgi:hypothetical protein
VPASNPPFRIASISIPTTIGGLISVTRTAISVAPGSSNIFLAVSGANLPSSSVLEITGDGITVGPTIFHPGTPLGQNSLEVAVQVSATATPGLRTFVVSNNGSVAYANGYLEIPASTPDFNFDGLDDRFQRQFWAPWTRSEAAPAADPDSDLFSNAFEFATGTNPTDSGSWSFLIESVKQSRIGATVTWKADLGKKYQLYSRPVLGGAGTWQPVGSPVSATNSTMSVVDPGAGGAEKFYRLQLLP